MKKTCFVLSPIGEAGSPTREPADYVLRELITPALRVCGFEPAVRADHVMEPGMITSQVIERILKSFPVIADLSGHNPNMFYELAICHVVKKPLVSLIEVGGKVPFDTAVMRAIPIDTKKRNSVQTQIEAIASHIRRAESPSARAETPISVAIEFPELRRQIDHIHQMSLRI